MSAESSNVSLKEFKKIVVDMTQDILLTFPEQRANISSDLLKVISGTDEADNETALIAVQAHCKRVYPEKFFDILYQNTTLFDSAIEFLPGIDFHLLWQDANISVKTRETIWKYLQLVLFTIISGVTDRESFGSSAKLFEAINEDEFRKKLEETIGQMHNIFSRPSAAGDNGVPPCTSADAAGDNGVPPCTSAAGDNGVPPCPGINLDDLPDPQDIHDHVTGMMGGKLGSLAREIAEETAADLNIDMENTDSVNDIFQRLMKNPTKLMSLIKNVGTKLDTKMKSGDIKESDLLKEASEIMQKMKNMPGMGNLQNMMSKMGMPGAAAAAAAAGGGGGGKVNMNAMQSNLDRNLKAALNKERLRAKLAARHGGTPSTPTNGGTPSTPTNGGTPATPTAQGQGGTPAHGKPHANLVFSAGEPIERSFPSDENKLLNKAKKKKNKNKK
jgi:hypothetical protein